MDLFERGGGRARGGRDEGAGGEETVEGTLERIVFMGQGGGFMVARLKVEGQPGLMTVVGSLMGVTVGTQLRVRGRREVNPKFGEQLRVSGFTEVTPQTLDGIKRYLGSRRIKGIGPEFARRIVDTFGLDTLKVLDDAPERIAEVRGIGRARARAVQEAWESQRPAREAMVFLQGLGISSAVAERIYRTKGYGPQTIRRVREDPYALAFDVWGIGFLSADRMANALGIARDAPARVDAGVRHILSEAAGNGHCYLPRDRLCEATAERLEVDALLVEAAIERLHAENKVVAEATPDGTAVFDRLLYQDELAVARQLLKLCGAAPRTRFAPDEVDAAITAYERASRLALARQQAEAIRQALREPVVVITGGPGVGKTTIVRGIVSILEGTGLHIELAAPTGRAAKRLGEATGRTAKTLHRLLEWNPQRGAFNRNDVVPLDADLLVVDEASMIDIRLGAHLLAALRPGVRLVLVGDVDQLPSVGPGAVLGDVIASGRVPVVRLTEIFRQAAESLIVTNAHRIHDGLPPELGAPAAGGPAADRRDFFFLEADDAAAAALVVRDLVATRLPRRYNLSPHDIQVLCPMHRGELGAGNLNQLLQEALTTGAPELRRGGRVFRVGDRVMQMRNDYDKDVFNGDVGRVERLGPARPEPGGDDAGGTDEGGDGGGGGGGGGGGADDDIELCVRMDDREVVYSGDELDQLALAYAATVHKSQGSEYPAVVLPIHTQHYVMLQRNLLYTAVTRGRRLVVLVGTRKALNLAIRNADVAKRATRLAARLAE